MDDEIATRTTLKSLYEFGRLAFTWNRDRTGISISLHPDTLSFLMSLKVLDLQGNIEGIATREDMCTPPGVLRIVYRGEHWDLAVDLEAARPGKSNPAGGSCYVQARCWRCGWNFVPAEGSTPEDGLVAANFFAQKHRAERGHGVGVEVKVSWAESFAGGELVE